MPFTFLLGGARSGKSTLAVRLASAFDGPVVVVATAEARDEDMAERIRAHRDAPCIRGRPSRRRSACSRWSRTCARTRSWSSTASRSGSRTRSRSDRRGTRSRARLARSRPRWPDARHPSVVVSNEVGLGIVPANELARRYRDVLGRVNGAVAAEAEVVPRRGGARGAARGGDAVVTGSALLERTLRSIPPPDDAAAAKVARLLDAKTKPPGSLGRLEDVAQSPRGDPRRGPQGAARAGDRRGRRRPRCRGPGCERVPAGGDRADARELRGRWRGDLRARARSRRASSSSSTPARSTRRRSPGCAPRSWTRHAGRRT